MSVIAVISLIFDRIQYHDMIYAVERMTRERMSMFDRSKKGEFRIRPMMGITLCSLHHLCSLPIAALLLSSGSFFHNIQKYAKYNLNYAYIRTYTHTRVYIIYIYICNL